MGKGKGRISTYLPLKAFCDRGHDVWYLTSSEKHKSENIDGINIRRIITIIKPLDKPRLISIRFIGFISHYLHRPFSILAFLIASALQGLAFASKYRPDVIYAHGIFSSIPAFLISRVVRSKYVSRSYGMGYNKEAILQIMFKTPADLYIVANDGTCGSKLAAKYGIPTYRLCFWVNGTYRTNAKPVMNNECKHTGFYGNLRTVLSLCRLEWDKQVALLIKAVPRVISEYRSVRFLIIGDGGERKRLEDLTVQLEVSDFVKFVGAVEHSKAIDHIELCDVLVSMNVLSSICNPVLEAMTCGRAVIALNTGTTIDLIKNDFNGLLLEANEIDRLPEFIVSLLKDDERRQRIGQNAQKFMLDNWPTWEQRVSLEVEIIESLCSSDRERFAEIKAKADKILDMTKWI